MDSIGGDVMMGLGAFINTDASAKTFRYSQYSNIYRESLQANQNQTQNQESGGMDMTTLLILGVAGYLIWKAVK